MPRCDKCGKKLITFSDFECSYCGKNFCSEHRLPESHNCEFNVKKKLEKVSVRRKEHGGDFSEPFKYLRYRGWRFKRLLRKIFRI
jgi:hypothetical protein